MKKPALLLCVFLALQVLPANAAMIVDDHFEGSGIDSAWDITLGSNTSGWDYQVQDSLLKVNQLIPTSDRARTNVSLSQNFGPIGDFNAEFGFSWEGSSLDLAPYFGIYLYDSEQNRISGIATGDSRSRCLDFKTVAYGDSETQQGGFLPLAGSGTASMVRENGVVSYYWDDILLASHNLLNQATTLELTFGFRYSSGLYEMGTASVDYVTLEGDPVDLSATPEPGTMMLLGSALGLSAWWQRRRKKRA
jgi:hypothetical protein